MEQPNTQWYGKMGNYGWVSRPKRAMPTAPTTLTLLCLTSTGEAYDAVCAGLARVLEITSRSQMTLEWVDRCPWRSRAFPWCPTCRGVPGDVRANEWHGLTVLEYMDREGEYSVYVSACCLCIQNDLQDKGQKTTSLSSLEAQAVRCQHAGCP